MARSRQIAQDMLMHVPHVLCILMVPYPHTHTVKAGGKRVVTKHKPHEKPDDDAYDQKYIDQLPEQP